MVGDIATSVDDLLERSIARFMAWDFDPIADQYATPLPVYTMAEVETYMSRDDLIAMLRHQRHEFSRLGVVQIAASVVTQSQTPSGRSCLETTWCYDLGPGKPLLTSTILYYCRAFSADCPQNIVIEMVEYRSNALGGAGAPADNVCAFPASAQRRRS